MSTLAEPPRVPLEVAENIIDTLGARKDVNSLSSCALTCRGWHPRARHHLMSSIRIQSKEDLFSISDYFAENPHIAGAVRSLVLHTEEPAHEAFLRGAVPACLLAGFPNLQSYGINDEYPTGNLPPICFHSTTLVGFKTLLLEELSLSHVVFRTCAELGRLLLALLRLRRLYCTDVSFQVESTPVTHAINMARFRNRCNRLLELTILEYYPSDIPLVNLIIKMPVALRALRLCVALSEEHSPLDLSDLTGLHSLSFTVRLLSEPRVPLDEYRALDLSGLTHLHSLTFIISIMLSDELVQLFTEAFSIIIKVLATASRNLAVLEITFLAEAKDMERAWDLQVGIQKCCLLEDAIIRLGPPRVMLWIPAVKQNRFPFWSKIMHDRFPRLHESGVLKVLNSSVDAEVQTVHNFA